MENGTIIYTLLGISAIAISFALGFLISYLAGKKSLGGSRRLALSIIDDARKEAEQHKRLELTKAREEWVAENNQREEEYQKRLDSVKNIERAMNRRDAKLQSVERELTVHEETIQNRAAEVEARNLEIDDKKRELCESIAEYMSKLEKVGDLSQDEARKNLIESLRKQAEFEAAALIRQIKEDAQRTAEIEAQKIVTLAIERVGIEQVAERTTSQFKLSDEGLKGRIIGHEGRNIKVFEEETGVQLLINNEDPMTLVLSAFNPVAREIARQSLERLIQSGKIHPKKIQEFVGKAKKKIQKEVLLAGEEAFRRLGLELPNPEIIKLIGQLKYRTSYGQNVLNHSIEVAELCGNMAAELGLDIKLARRAGLLHDLGKAIDVVREGTHPELGSEAARKYNEHEVVINAIESHHEDVEVIHPISILVAVADGISGSRPGARRASITDYFKRIETLESIANSFEGVEQSFAIQAGREIRVIVNADHVSDMHLPFLAGEIAKKIQEDLDYPGKVKVTIIRERKAVEYAGAAAG
jgi:ribonucrease Y